MGTDPLTPLLGVEVKAVALQVAFVIFVIAGTGLTVTVTVNVEPLQLPAVGVTV